MEDVEPADELEEPVEPVDAELEELLRFGARRTFAGSPVAAPSPAIDGWPAVAATPGSDVARTLDSPSPSPPAVA